MANQLNQLPTSLEPIGSVGNTAPVVVSPIWYKFFSSVASLFSNSGGGGPASALLDTLGSTLGGMLARFGGGWAEFVASAPNQVPVMNPAAPVVLKNISQLLDLLGSVHGEILFRGTAAWQVLAPSAGGFLQSHGAGFDPTYGTLSPGAPVTSVQFNNGGTFGGQADFTFDAGSGLVSLPSLDISTGSVITPDGAAIGNGIGFIVQAGVGGITSGDGGIAFVKAGSATTDGAGGQMLLQAGSGVGAHGGGQNQLVAGDGGATGDGGAIGIFAGNGGATSGFGGDATLEAGNGIGAASNGGATRVLSGTAGTTGTGGGLTVIAGDGGSTSGAGGPLTVEAGSAIGAGAGGALDLFAGEGGTASGNGGAIVITAGSAHGGNTDGGNITLTPGAKNGAGVVGHILLVTLENFADDVAAAAGGVPITGLYRTASAVKVRVT